MRKLANYICIILAIFSCGIAEAQENLGDIVKEGGKKLSAQDLRDTLVGKTFIRKNKRGNEINVDVKPDGSIGGYLASYQGSMGISGKWNMSEDGKMCVDYAFTDVNIPGASWCGYHFAIANRYFFSDSDNTPEAKVWQWWLK